MKNVKFLTTSAGTYGVAHTGDELTLKDSVAVQLEKNGVVKVLGDAKEGTEESVAKGSFRINDQTSNVKEKEEVDDKNDPTNEKKNKEKVSKAGPNAPKKK